MFFLKQNIQGIIIDNSTTENLLDLKYDLQNLINELKIRSFFNNIPNEHIIFLNTLYRAMDSIKVLKVSTNFDTTKITEKEITGKVLGDQKEFTSFLYLINRLELENNVIETQEIRLNNILEYLEQQIND